MCHTKVEGSVLYKDPFQGTSKYNFKCYPPPPPSEPEEKEGEPASEPVTDTSDPELVPKLAFEKVSQP